ncbi:protein neprosin-like [Corylus avellana]|uniref:protein neprosin-like n=1 Tax=Corylus avellana TaxID=13451 RepID=UPI00286BAC36|nr:protein neprosin-like [Corylus avellana]
MEPSSIPNVTNGEFYDAEQFHSFLENGQCSEGTIPIRHAREDEYYATRVIPPTAHQEKLNFRLGNETNGHEADEYKTTGCYNIDCPGFVEVNHRIALGSALNHISSHKGSQCSVEISINKVILCALKDEVLGYWPSSIIKELEVSATSINWGGEIYDSGQQDHHTTTQMGSGNFPSDSLGTSYFCYIQYMDDKGYFVDPDINPNLLGGLIPFESKSTCYNIEIKQHQNENYRTHFYFGGPGYSAICP